MQTHPSFGARHARAFPSVSPSTAAERPGPRAALRVPRVPRVQKFRAQQRTALDQVLNTSPPVATPLRTRNTSPLSLLQLRHLGRRLRFLDQYSSAEQSGTASDYGLRIGVDPPALVEAVDGGHLGRAQLEARRHCDAHARTEPARRSGSTGAGCTVYVVDSAGCVVCVFCRRRMDDVDNGRRTAEVLHDAAPGEGLGNDDAASLVEPRAVKS